MGCLPYQRRQARTSDRSGQRGSVDAGEKPLPQRHVQSYGSRRMATQLQDDGCAVGRCKARRLMHAGGRAGATCHASGANKPRRVVMAYGIADNVLARHCAVAKPEQAWAGDITYRWTAEGWWSVSVLLDVYARKVVGWAMRSHIDTALVQEALTMALGRRRPAVGSAAPLGPRQSICQSRLSRRPVCPRDCLSHEGQGGMSGQGGGGRFFGSVKREWTSHCAYATRQEASSR